MRQLITGAALAILLAAPLTAHAHTPDEVDAWLAEFTASIPQSGMTLEHAHRYTDFMTRHEWYVSPPIRESPRAAPQPSPSPSPPPSVEAWRPLVTAHFAASQVDRALCIMHHESRGDPTATNPSSGAAGLFQHLPRYWADRSTKAGRPGADIYDPDDNVAVAAWLQKIGGWGHWAPYNRGLCH